VEFVAGMVLAIGALIDANMQMCKSQNTILALLGKQHLAPPWPWLFNPSKQKN
jgi:hypothetical protein